MTTAFYIWLYALGVAIAHDHSLYLNQSKGRKMKRFYLFLPAIQYRARQRRKTESDETTTKK